MAEDLKTLEAALARAVDAAVCARADLNAARRRAGLDSAEPQFYTAAQWRDRDDRELKNYIACAKAGRAERDPNDEFAHMAKLSEPDTAKDRAMFAWIDTLAAADKIVRERAAEKEEAAKAAIVTATAADVVRAGKIARGEIIEMPTGAVARAIVEAGRKRRGD